MNKLIYILLSFIISVTMLTPDVYAKGVRHEKKSSRSSTHSTTNGNTTHVRGYTKKNGTYVAPHRRTKPDKSKSNNWSSKGNTNPDTEKAGTKEP